MATRFVILGGGQLTYPRLAPPWHLTTPKQKDSKMIRFNVDIDKLWHQLRHVTTPTGVATVTKDGLKTVLEESISRSPEVQELVRKARSAEDRNDQADAWQQVYTAVRDITGTALHARSEPTGVGKVIGAIKDMAANARNAVEPGELQRLRNQDSRSVRLFRALSDACKWDRGVPPGGEGRSIDEITDALVRAIESLGEKAAKLDAGGPTWWSGTKDTLDELVPNWRSVYIGTDGQKAIAAIKSLAAPRRSELHDVLRTQEALIGLQRTQSDTAFQLNKLGDFTFAALHAAQTDCAHKIGWIATQKIVRRFVDPTIRRPSARDIPVRSWQEAAKAFADASAPDLTPLAPAFTPEQIKAAGQTAVENYLNATAGECGQQSTTKTATACGQTYKDAAQAAERTARIDIFRWF
jgi:hypothetical protein